MCTDNPSPPQWHPHDDADYDKKVGTLSAAALEHLRNATTAERQSFASDPRDVHRRLYETLTPAGYSEYAGTYRGTAGTSLEHRNIVAKRLSDDSHHKFLAPEKVSTSLSQIQPLIDEIFGNAGNLSESAFMTKVTQIFYTFGLVHPFLDGNGHIQRLIFAACMFERSDLKLLPAWTIHPRPYDDEVALAFEEATFANRIRRLREELCKYVI